jgi:hypothetical protein
MSKYDFSINKNRKQEYLKSSELCSSALFVGIPQDLLNSQYTQFAKYYNIPKGEYFRDIFEPWIRICIYFGSPIIGKYSAIKFSRTYIINFIKNHKLIESRNCN